MNQMLRTLDKYFRERRARIVSWLEGRTEAEAAVAVCERWLVDLLDRDITLWSPRDLASLPPELSLVRRLSEAKLNGLAGALSWRIEGAQTKERAETALIQYALAAASGRAYAVHNPGKHDWIGGFVTSIGGSWEDFADSAAGTLRGDLPCSRHSSAFLLRS